MKKLVLIFDIISLISSYGRKDVVLKESKSIIEGFTGYGDVYPITLGGIYKS